MPKPGPLTVAAVLASAVYAILAVRFAARIATSQVNESARTFFWGWLAATIVLYLAALATAISERRRSSAPVPILGAALFGSLICVFFYGP